MPNFTMRVFRGDPAGGDFKEYKVESGVGMVVLDEIMLDAGFVRLRKDFLPIDDSAAHFGHLWKRVAEILSA